MILFAILSISSTETPINCFLVIIKSFETVEDTKIKSTTLHKFIITEYCFNFVKLL